MYCLDTSIVIDIFRGNEELKNQLEVLSSSYGISSPVLCELFKGAYTSPKKEKSLQDIEHFMKGTVLLSFNKESCALFGQKYAELKNKGKPTQEIDLMIGCIALVHQAILVTKNGKHFKNISGLQVMEI